MRRALVRIIALVSILAIGAGPALAKDQKKKEFPDLDKVVKDMTADEGFYTLYKKKEQLYALIPAARLGQPFLLAASISAGPLAGHMWDDWLVQWERVDKYLILVKPDLRHRARKDSPLGLSVKRTYTDTVLASTPILSLGGGGVLIDLGTLFKNDRLAQVASYLGKTHIDSRISKWTKWKTFPGNVEIAVNAVFEGSGPLAGLFAAVFGSDLRGGLRATVHYSLLDLPGNAAYKPRRADERVGYFITAHKKHVPLDLDKTQFVRLIQRWDLQPADKNLALSPPKKPIKFYIEKTVPYRYRRYVREAILEWNRPFEKIGFSGAIEVLQQTADNEYADYDPEDARYNFIRWGTSGDPFAMGPSRVDPRTGQVINATIFVDDSMVRSFANEFSRLSPRQRLSVADPAFSHALETDPRARLIRRLLSDPAPAALPTPLAARHRLAAHLSRRRRRPICTFAVGKGHQMAFARVAHLLKTGKEVPEEFIGETLKDTVLHEFGHILGLRHNFKASSWRPLGAINSKEKPAAITASVMDYTPVNVVSSKSTQGRYQNTTLGPYDYWAIEYGYKRVKGEELAKIASRSAEPGHAYATDEDTSLLHPDPTANRWDLGADLFEFAADRFVLIEELKGKLAGRVLKGQSWSRLRRDFDTLLFEVGFTSQLIARYIGGQYFNRHHKGDPKGQPPLVVVPGKKQREALALLARHVFDDRFFRVAPDLLNHLAPGRWEHWGSDDFSFRIDYPLHAMVLRNQARTLALLLAPWTLDRIREAALKAGKDPFTLGELFRALNGAIWTELWQVGNISSLRRQLQRTHLLFLGSYALADTTSDVQALSRHMLRELRAALEGKRRVILDVETRAHVEDVLERIERTLKARYVVR